MRFLLNTAGDFFARLVLSIIKSVQANLSRPFEIFTYNEGEKPGHGQGKRIKGGAGDGEGG